MLSDTCADAIADAFLYNSAGARVADGFYVFMVLATAVALARTMLIFSLNAMLSMRGVVWQGGALRLA